MCIIWKKQNLASVQNFFFSTTAPVIYETNMYHEKSKRKMQYLISLSVLYPIINENITKS